MDTRRTSKPRPPLDAAKLNDLALFYVGRFATSRAKLLSYLSRKVRERGWEGSIEPDLPGLADRLVGLGYVDDRAFAVAKARSLTARGYGSRRVVQALAVAGIGEDEGADAKLLAEQGAVEAALRFARRRSLGPFASVVPDPRQRERAIAAMIRAGHGFALAKTIIALEPGAETDVESLLESY